MVSVDSNPHGASLIAIIVFGLVVVPLSYGLRVWARHNSAVAFSWDDIVMGFALIGALAVVVDNIVGVHYGGGYHVEDLSSESVEKYGQTLFAFFFLQTTTVTLIKASLLLLYWRTFTLKGFRYAIYVVSAIICANAVESILGFLLQCLPVPKFWNHTLPGHCINQKLFITLASVLYMITDLIIYVMPMPIIWQLHMTKRRKVELSIVFLLGGFVCLTGIARIYYTNLLDVKNITYTNANPAIWNIVESQVGFVAANVPSMGPLFGKAGSVVKKIRHNYASQSFEHGMHTSTKYTVSRRGSTDGFKRMMDDDVVGVESIAKPGSIFADGDFAESIPMNEIVVKTNVEQTHKSRPSLEAI